MARLTSNQVRKDMARRKLCFSCGRRRCLSTPCPAKSLLCENCGQKGHLRICCTAYSKPGRDQSNRSSLSRNSERSNRSYGSNRFFSGRSNYSNRSFLSNRSSFRDKNHRPNGTSRKPFRRRNDVRTIESKSENLQREGSKCKDRDQKNFDELTEILDKFERNSICMISRKKNKGNSPSPEFDILYGPACISDTKIEIEPFFEKTLPDSGASK